MAKQSEEYIRAGFRFNPKLIDELKTVAKTEGLTFQNLLRKILGTYISEKISGK